MQVASGGGGGGSGSLVVTPLEYSSYCTPGRSVAYIYIHPTYVREMDVAHKGGGEGAAYVRVSN